MQACGSKCRFPGPKALSGSTFTAHMDDIAAHRLTIEADAIDLGLEFECATMARNAANYAATNKVTLAGATRWTQAGSTPIADIKTGCEAICASPC